MAKPPRIKKPEGQDLPELPVADAVAVRSPSPRPAPPLGATEKTSGLLPSVLEFRPVDSAALWRVEKFDLLAVEFWNEPKADGAAAWMAQFVFFCQGHARFWLLVRRLYGVGPVIPPPEATPDDLRVWTREELAGDGFQVKADLEALGAMWKGHCQRAGLENPNSKNQTSREEPPVARGELPLDDAILQRLQFSERLFKITIWDPMLNEGKGGEVPRGAEENRAEREWFVRRVTEWRKMLEDGMGGPVARTALMNDLYLRRLESEIATASPKQRAGLYEQKTALAEEYNNAVERLQEMFPEMAVAGKVTFRGTLSDLVVAVRDYYGNKDNRLVDKIFTTAEIELQMRASVQVAERHRFGLNIAIMDNIEGLFDPEFRPRFKPRVLKKLDAATQAAIAVARESEEIVDLESGVMPGEGDDFEDFNDADCPHCGGRISSQARRCPECRRQIKK